MCGGAENAAKLYLGATGLSGTPGNGFDWQGEFAQKIQKILASGTKIVVIQSPVDTLPYNEKLGSNYQYRFPTDTSSAITVYNINLETKGSTPIEQGINAHIDIFSTYAMNHITNGVYVNPQNPWNSNVNQPYVPKTSTPQRSESSIVGKWNFQYQDLFYHNTTLDFYVDGTFIFPGSGAYGKWTQDGNSINMHFDSGWASHPNTAGMLKTSEGIFTMEGEGPGWNWYAEKVGAYPDPRGFPGQEEPGLF